jgi:imidazolonepropionase-like amidohydrolase
MMIHNSILIKNARIVQNKTITTEKSILISDGIIQEIKDDFECINENYNNEKIKTINAKSYYVTPGLIDAHVHLILNGSKNIIKYVNTTTKKELKHNAVQNIIQALMSGITSLRDMGDTSAIVAKIKNNPLPSHHPPPTILSSGKMLTAQKGHVKTIARNLTSHLLDIQNAVDEQVYHKADFIKLIISGGLLTPNSSPIHSELSNDLIKHVCTRASEHQVPVAVHAYTNKDVKNAIRAGATSIEHGIWSTKETIHSASKKNILFIPTLKAAYGIINHKDSLPNYMVKNAELVLSQAPTFLKHAKKYHVDLAMGTDAGTPFNYHGDNAMELQYLTEHGLSTAEALQSATAIPGRLFRKNVLTGLIKKGYCADLLLISKNPFNDITAFQHNIKYVISKGIIVNNLCSN